MCPLSNTNGSYGYGEIQWETGNTSEASERKIFRQNLINKANSVPIINIFRHYHIHLTEINRVVKCPFKSHKGGKEFTASFHFYPETNSYCCYGCNHSRFGCDFVAEMDHITKYAAAVKIIDWFGSEIDKDKIIEQEDFSEKLKIILDLSGEVKKFYSSSFNENSLVRLEYICWVYDELNYRHDNLNNKALSYIVQELKKEIFKLPHF